MEHPSIRRVLATNSMNSGDKGVSKGFGLGNLIPGTFFLSNHPSVCLAFCLLSLEVWAVLRID